MCSGLNRVVLVGTVADVKESRATASGSTVLTALVTTSERWRDKASGELRERIERHRVKGFSARAAEGLADVAPEDVLCIEGSLRTESFIDAQGQRRYFTVIVAERVERVFSNSSAGRQRADPSRNSAPTRQSGFDLETGAGRSFSTGTRQGYPVARVPSAGQQSTTTPPRDVAVRESVRSDHQRPFGRGARG